MKYLFAFFATALLLSCRQEIDSASTMLIGRYTVTMYAGDRDTLYFPGKVNKDNYKEFYLDVVKRSSDTLIVYTMTRKDVLCGYGFSAVASKVGDKYKLASPFNSLDKDGGYFEGNTMYLKTAADWNDSEQRIIYYTTVAVKQP